MTAPEHLTISGPEDILGYIPHSLGYWPSQSLVAMTMQGKRLGATLRVDLPEGGGRRSREAFARTVAEYLLADREADGTLLVFFDDGGFDDGGFDDGGFADGGFDDGDLADGGLGDGSRQGAALPSLHPLLADLECSLGLAGMPVRDAWLVGAEHWRNVYCTDNTCCPPPGRPIAEIRDSRLNAEMVYLGSSVGAPPGTAAPGRADVPAADTAAVMAAEQRWSVALAGKGSLRTQFDAVLDAWSVALEAASPAAVSPAPTSLEPGSPQCGSPTAALRGEGPVPAEPAVAGAGAARPPAAGSGCGVLAPELAGFLRASLRVPAWRDAVLVMAAAGRAAAAAGAETFGIFSSAAGTPVAFPPQHSPSGSPGRSNCGPEGIAESEAEAPEAGALAADAVGTGTPRTGTCGTGAGRRAEHSAVPGCPEPPGTSTAGLHPAPAACGPKDLPGYGEVLLGLSPPVPDWEALKRLEGLMQVLSSCGGGEAQAAALTANGWIEWCRGRGSFAHASLVRALDASPGYRLAELLSEVVRRGTICGWAGRREAAWQKFGSDAA